MRGSGGGGGGGRGEDFLAEDRVRFGFACGQEGDVVAEARGVNAHEVAAGADFFDPADAVGRLRVAVELDFDFAGARGEVAGCAAGEGLREIAC